MATWGVKRPDLGPIVVFLVVAALFGPGVVWGQDEPIPAAPKIDEPIPAPPKMAEPLEPIPRPEPIPPGVEEDEPATLDLLEDHDELVPGSGEPLDGDLSGMVFCDGDPASVCDDCGTVGGYWMRAEYLQWWTKGSRMPPLLTTSTDPHGGGALDDPATAIVFGNTRVANRGRSSFRIRLGYWFDPCRNLGWDVEYFDLGLQPTSIVIRSTGDPVLARPYFDVVNQIQASLLIAYPGVTLGEFGARNTHYFQSTGTRLRRTLLCYSKCATCDAGCGTGCGHSCSIEGGTVLRGQGDETGSWFGDGCGSGCGSACTPACCGGTAVCLDLIAGYRHYRMSDNLGIREIEVVTGTGTQAQVGTAFEINERFETTNRFNGGEIGLIGRIDRGCWSFEFLAKVAMGNNHQRVLIDGETIVTVPGQNPVTYRGGLLALPTNIGIYTRDEFVVIPHFGAEVGYQLTPCLRVFFGYDFLYWANVTGSGDAIDMVINPSQIPPDPLEGEARPIFNWHDDAFWAQGIRIGAEWRF